MAHRNRVGRRPRQHRPECAADRDPPRRGRDLVLTALGLRHCVEAGCHAGAAVGAVHGWSTTSGARWLAGETGARPGALS